MSQSLLTDNVTQATEIAGTEAPGSVRQNALFQTKTIFALRGRFMRFVTSAFATLLLLGFLSFSRWLDARSAQPDTTIRTLSSIEAVQINTPPPPPPSEPPPPPPKTPPLPKLDIQINSPAPPIKAVTDPTIRPNMAMASFSNNQPQERKRMVFSMDDLDGKPKLVHRPSFSYPKSLKDRGISEGQVKLEVIVQPDGSVDVLRVVESDHIELETPATNFAQNARFTAPKKDGRLVATRFHWPLRLN